MSVEQKYVREQVLPVFVAAYQKVVTNPNKTFLQIGYIENSRGEPKWAAFSNLSNLSDEELFYAFYHLILINSVYEEAEFSSVQVKTMGRYFSMLYNFEMEFKTQVEKESFIDFCKWCKGVSATARLLDEANCC